MKWKIISFVVAIMFVVVSCSSSADASVSYDLFNMEYLGQDAVNWSGTFYHYVDTETGVEYIVYKSGDASAITTRYERFGEVYINTEYYEGK